MRSDRWLLPEGVPEVLPPESWRLEAARRRLLDLYWRWGFDLIRPPLIEYLDSLLTGAGHNLDLQTFKLTDQLSGRMLGVRSDMTTQAARIDAHRLPVAGPARYCYIGSVLRTRPEEPGGSRSPLQIGVELFGHAGPEADLEVLSLMLESLRAMGIADACLDLGHVAIYRALVTRAGIDGDAEASLFDVMQRKSRPDLRGLIGQGRLSPEAGEWFETLIDLNGSAEVLDAAAELAAVDPAIGHALAELRGMSERLARHYPDVPLYLDLAELRGYRYKTGMVFAAFAPGHGRELARGGRYDKVGAAFGRARPATGFSADLNLLAALGDPPTEPAAAGVFAPAGSDPALLAAIRNLRAEGRRVVTGLPDDGIDAAAAGCDQQLVYEAGEWRCRPATGQEG
jgi:ATP phosphoribosyltransferase regulatory subunit